MRGVPERAWRRLYKIEAHTKQDGRCLYCRLPLPLVEATAEHCVPVARHGQTTAENIAAACELCNNAKRHMTRAEFMRAIHEPDYRRDPWPLYLACAQIRLRLQTSAACRRLRRIVEVRAAGRVAA